MLRHIDLDGTITDVPTSRSARPTRAGDVLQESLEGSGSTFYRPGAHTAYRLPKLPFDSPQGVVLDERGTVWVLVDWTRTGRSSRARRRDRPLAAHHGAAAPSGRDPGRADRRGREVLVPTRHGNGEYPLLDGVWTHLVDGDPGAAWTQVPTAGVSFEDTLQPLVARALSDGRIVLTGDSGEVWVQGDDGGFERVSHPLQGPDGLRRRSSARGCTCPSPATTSSTQRRHRRTWQVVDR